MVDDKKLRENLTKLMDINYEKILEYILNKMKDMKTDGYNPTYVVLWTGYYEVLIRNFRGRSHIDISDDGICKVLGLKPIITEKKDIIEVY